MLRWLRWGIIIVFFVIAALFAMDNAHSVTLYFSLTSLELTLPLFVLLWLFLMIGVLLAWLITLSSRTGLRLKARNLEAEATALRNELKALKLEIQFASDDEDEE